MKLMLLLKHFQITSPGHPDSSQILALNLPEEEEFLQANAINSREGKTREINWPQTFARNIVQTGCQYEDFVRIYQRDIENEIIYGFVHKDNLDSCTEAAFELTQSGEPTAALQGDIITRGITTRTYSAKQVAVTVIPVSLTKGASNRVPPAFFGLEYSRSMTCLHAAHALIPRGHRVRDFQEKFITAFSPKSSVYQYGIHLAT